MSEEVAVLDTVVPKKRMGRPVGSRNRKKRSTKKTFQPKAEETFAGPVKDWSGMVQATGTISFKLEPRKTNIAHGDFEKTVDVAEEFMGQFREFLKSRDLYREIDISGFDYSKVD